MAQFLFELSSVTDSYTVTSFRVELFVVQPTCWNYCVVFNCIEFFFCSVDFGKCPVIPWLLSRHHAAEILQWENTHYRGAVGQCVKCDADTDDWFNAVFFVQRDLSCTYNPKPADPLVTFLELSVCQLPAPSCDGFYGSLFPWGMARR